MSFSVDGGRLQKPMQLNLGKIDARKRVPESEQAQTAASAAVDIHLESDVEELLDAPEINQAEASNLAYLVKMRLQNTEITLTAPLSQSADEASELAANVGQQLGEAEIFMSSEETQTKLSAFL